MAVMREIRDRSRQIVLPVIGICVIGYFLYHSVQGDRGVLSYLRLNLEVKKAEATLASLRGEREDFDQRVANLNPKSLDADMLDEMVRANLNLLNQDEVVIFLPKAN